MSLQSKAVLITGANAGMGYQTALHLAKRDARLILGCRNMQAGQKAVKKIIEASRNESVVTYELDLACFTSIKKFASTVIKNESRLDVLINNAGVFMLPLRRTSNNIEMHFGVNFLGHFLLTNLLLNKLRKEPDTRIINVASNVPQIPVIDFDDINSEKSYNRVKAVLQSKQSILLYTKYMAYKLGDSGVTINSVDPGLVMNDFGRNRDYWYGYFQVGDVF